MQKRYKRKGDNRILFSSILLCFRCNIYIYIYTSGDFTLKYLTVLFACYYYYYFGLQVFEIFVICTGSYR